MAKGEIVLDFTKTVDDSKVHDAGPYPVIIKTFELKGGINGEIKPNSEGKWPYFIVRAEITDGPNAGERLWCMLTVDPSETKNGNSKNFMLFGFLKALGQDIETGGKINLDPEEVINKPMIWHNKPEEYEGSYRDKINKFEVYE